MKITSTESIAKFLAAHVGREFRQVDGEEDLGEFILREVHPLNEGLYKLGSDYFYPPMVAWIEPVEDTRSPQLAARIELRHDSL